MLDEQTGYMSTKLHSAEDISDSTQSIGEHLKTHMHFTLDEDRRSQMDVQIVPIRDESEISVVCLKAKRLAKKHQFSKTDTSRLLTAVSELAWNIIKYANIGRCLLRAEDTDAGKTVIAVFEDHGPGISNINAALQDGYTTGGGLGGGLPGTKRLVDTFNITSAPGHTVVMIGVRARLTRYNHI